MYSTLIRKGPVFAFLAALVLIIIAIIPIIGGMEALSSIPDKEQAFAPEGDIFYTALYITAALFVIAVAAAILLSVYNIIRNPKESTRGLIAFGVLLVLFFVFYAMADADASGSLKQTMETFKITPGVSKLIGASIRLTLLLGLGSVVLMVVLEIWNYFKTQ